MKVFTILILLFYSGLSKRDELEERFIDSVLLDKFRGPLYKKEYMKVRKKSFYRYFIGQCFQKVMNA